MATEWKRMIEANMMDKAMKALNEALESPDPKIRLDAARYVQDRVLGRPTDTTKMELTQQPFTVVTPGLEEQQASLAKALKTRDDEETEAH